MMTIAELMALVAHVNRHGDFAALNDGGFPDEDDPDLRFGTSSEFFINSFGDTRYKNIVVDLAEEYYLESQPPPTLLVQESAPAKLKSVDDIRRVLGTRRDDDPTVGDLAAQMTDPEETLSFYIKSLPRAGRPRGPSYREFSCLIDGRRYRTGGSISYSTSIHDLFKEPHAFAAQFTRRCGSIKPFFAVSGLSLLFDTYSGYASGRAYPLYRRFPGLTYAKSTSFSSGIVRRDDCIRDVNWLTAVSDAMLARVGGTDAAHASLGPDVLLHPYDGGVVFQAGPAPRFGDNNAGDVPEPYRQVNRFLRPLRFEGWTGPMYFLNVPSGIDRGEATAAWISRFD